MPGMQYYFKDIGIRKKKKDLVVGVIAGGISSEREISLKTGKNIYDSLLRSGYNAIFIDPNSDFINKLKSVDRAFLALHGRFGEDGTIQGLLEMLKIPYTGSGVLSSAMVIDKVLTKKILQFEDILTPEFQYINSRNSIFDKNKAKLQIMEKMDFPLVIKPNREGSTLGINIVKEEYGLEPAIMDAVKYDPCILIEKYIKGRELTVGIIGEDPVALPVSEIKPKSGVYDYYSKYTKNMTEYIVPAKLKGEILSHVSDIAVRSHNALECSGISRVDFILNNENMPYVLEINTMPGMTETSLVPKAASKAGLSFDLLVEIILNFANLKI